MEGLTPAEDHDFKGAFERLEKAVRTCCSEEPQRSMTIELQTFLALSRTAESLVMSLENEMPPRKIGQQCASAVKGLPKAADKHHAWRP
jgi:hypothetical protein